MGNECKKKFVYLLDEYVGFENIGFISATLVETIESLTTFEIPERSKEPSLKPLLSSSKTPKKGCKGYEGKHTSIPFAGCAITNEIKEIIDWLKGKHCIIPSYF